MHTILIIEDEESLRLTLADRLTLEGFHVQTAASGEEGLRQVREGPPDLILCDIMMPGLDGYGVLRALQSAEPTAAIPFIFLSAKADLPQVRAGMELGADDYLCKPVDKAHLLAAIRSRLHKRAEEQARVVSARQGVMRKLPHELLTPLTGLLTAGQLLEGADSTLPLAKVRALGQVVSLSAQRLHRLIRQFLLYAELEAASHDPKAQARLRGIGYIPATAWLAAHAGHLAQKDGRTQDLQLDLRDAGLLMDPAHFAELVGQLVDNAFKFSPPGSVVRIHLDLLPGDQCELSVNDHGRGMQPDQIAQVEAFRQFDTDVRSRPGTGLGLALAGRIAALYGGTLALDSEPGKGTQVRVCLPQARPGTPGARITDLALRRNLAWSLGSQQFGDAQPVDQQTEFFTPSSRL